MEIEIHVGNRWDGQEELLAKRIASIVGTDDSCCYEKDYGYKWNLDARKNDWKMSGIENGKIKISYRYGNSYEEEMKALGIFIQWKLGENNDE